jgi:hypothetical protein
VNHVYLYLKAIGPGELRPLLDTLGLPFKFMILEHFDKVEPGIYTPGLLRPAWLNRARFFGAEFELRCRLKAERLWTVLTSERQLPEATGEEEVALYQGHRFRAVNLWGRLIPRSSTCETPRWYEERLMQPISYPVPEAPDQVDLVVKEYLDQVGGVVAHRFVGFLPHKHAGMKA